MADSTSRNPLSGLKSMSPQARKGMIAFGVGAVVVVGATALLAGKRDSNAGIPASIQMAQIPDGVADPTAPVSQEYSKLVHEAEQKRFKEAAAVPGQMVLPSMVGLTDVNAKPEAPGGVPTAANPMTQQPGGAVVQQQEQPPVKTPQMEQRESAQYASMTKHLGRIVDRSLSPSSGLSIVLPQSSMGQAPMPVTASGQGSAQVAPIAQAATTQSDQAAPLVRAGAISFGTLDLALNTDFSGPVIATVLDGRFKNARVVGTKTLEQDAVVLRFNTLSPADGAPSIAIEAYAIRIDDAKKFGLTGLQGHTDYHVIQRYVLPAAAVFAQAYGAAASQRSQQIIQTQDGLLQTTPQLSAKDRMIAGAGAAMQPIVNDLARAGTRPITQSLDANTEIGILFARDVMATNAQGVQAPINAVTTQGAAPTGAAAAPPASQPIVQPQPAQYPAQYPVQSAYGYQRLNQPVGYVPYPNYGQQTGAYQR